MTWTVTLTSILNRLSALYFDPTEIRLLAARASLDITDIAFDPKARNYWQNIITYARVLDEGSSNNDNIISLLDTVTSPTERGRKDDILKTILHNYKNRIFSDEKGPSPDENWRSIDGSIQFEKIIGETSTLLPISFLKKGILCSMSVVRIVWGNTLGTGFLSNNNFIITNNHVLPTREAAREAIIQFNYENNWDGSPVSYENFKLDPDSGFYTSENYKDPNSYDYTAAKIAFDANSRFGSLAFSLSTPRINDSVFIIQHPSGGPKQIALSHNTVTFVDEHKIQYLTDTMPGSSGSPVFNDKWEVVALHNSVGWSQEPGLSRTAFRNQGINAQRIIERLNPTISIICP